MACRDRHLLLARAQIADRVRPYGAAGLEIPERLAGGRVQREEFSLRAASEYQATRRRHHARPRRPAKLEFPLHFARVRLECTHRAPWVLARNAARAAGVEDGTGLVFRFALVINSPFFPHGYVEQVGLRSREGRRGCLLR